MKVNFIDLKKQYSKYKEDIDNAVLKVLSSGAYINGPEISKLEGELAKYCNVPHAIAVSSGTDALLLSLMAYEIEPGDEIITVPFTFYATVEVIIWLNARPVFVDIDERTYNLDPSLLEKAITEKTRGIIAVDLYGQCADYDKINEIAAKHNLFVIEDAAQSFGATYKGRRACSLTETAATSFYPAKPFGCYGDGGMLFTHSDKVAERVKQLKDHGQIGGYQHKYVGINGRLDTIQAAILLEKFKHFEKEVELRQVKAEYYNKSLADLTTVPYIEEHNKSVYAQYSIRVDDRENFRNYMNEQQVPTAIHYPKPLHKQEALLYLGYEEGEFPVSEAISKEIISLPMHPHMTAEEQGIVINAIKSFKG